MKDVDKIIQVTSHYIEEAKMARRDRMALNARNWDIYHLRQDYSHKQEGQSREFLAKQSMAVEQIVTFFQQGLVDTSEWFSCNISPGVTNPLLTEQEMKNLLSYHLNKANIMSFVGDALKLGLLGSLMIAKIGGKYCKYPQYYTTERLGTDGKTTKELRRVDRSRWELDLSLVRQQDYYPDPNAALNRPPLYECQTIYMDISELFKLAENPDSGMVKSVLEMAPQLISEEQEEKFKKARENAQNTTFSNYRGRVKLTECWGNVIDPKDGKLLHENVTWTVINDQHLLIEPRANPFWHGESPFVTAPIIRVPFSTWHKALMDAPTAHNIAANELYNLILDSGLMATHGIKQIRPDWLEDTSEVENGVAPGQTLRVNTQCPPGGKVLERVDTSALSSDSLAVFQLVNAEFNQSSLTNDLRMGVLPSRAVKATEVVEASQTITSVFTGVTKVVETDFINKVLNKSMLTIAQNADNMDSQEMVDILGASRAQELASVSREDRFVALATGIKFQAYGVSSVLSKMKDFRKLTALLQTVFSSDLLAEEFLKKYSPGRFLEEILRSLDINTDKIKISEDERLALLANSNVAPQAGMVGPNMQSNIPQAGAGSTNETVESRIPRTNFPRTSGGVQT